MVLALRADFYGQALQHRGLADALQNAAVLLGPMTRDELRRAIEEPARSRGVTFEAGLADRILDEVEHEPGHLPLLEFTLTLLWEKQTAAGSPIAPMKSWVASRGRSPATPTGCSRIWTKPGASGRGGCSCSWSSPARPPTTPAGWPAGPNSARRTGRCCNGWPTTGWWSPTGTRPGGRLPRLSTRR